MLKNILKIVFLGVVGFGLLVYLTAEKPQAIKVDKKDPRYPCHPRLKDYLSFSS